MTKKRETRSKGRLEKKELKGSIRVRGLGVITRHEVQTAQICVVSKKSTTTVAKMGDMTVPILPKYFLKSVRVFRQMSV